MENSAIRAGHGEAAEMIVSNKTRGPPACAQIRETLSARKSKDIFNNY